MSRLRTCKKMGCVYMSNILIHLKGLNRNITTLAENWLKELWPESSDEGKEIKLQQMCFVGLPQR